MMRIRPLSTSITLLMALIVLAAPLIVNAVMAAMDDKPAIEEVASSD
jgi:hypothetical protein